MWYIVSLVFLLLFYVGVVMCMKHMRNPKLWNTVFTLSVVGCYLYVVIRTYLSVGLHDWNFQNTLPVANVSPFMFALVALMPLIPLKVRKHLYLLISLLSVGMLVSAVLGCVYNASINYNFYMHFLADYFAHVAISLWGVYMIKSRQVSLTKSNCLISSCIIVGVAVVMLIIILIFDTAFFGLSLNGKHNIYNNVITENSYLSAMFYFCGLIGVLCMGLLYSRLMMRTASSIDSSSESGEK